MLKVNSMNHLVNKNWLYNATVYAYHPVIKGRQRGLRKLMND